MLSRRDVISRAFCAIFASSLSRAQEDQDWKTELKIWIDANKDQTVTLGHVLPPPDDKSWEEAHAILASAPTRTTPCQVAEYFLRSVPEKYQRSWPEPDLKNPTYANPLIVLFFAATKSRPYGDVTPWCAAFANWCLLRTGIRGTNDAASKTFRDWGQPVWSRADGGMPTLARMGDVAVFRRRSDPDHGHVCFFRQVSLKHPNAIEVLGGNQVHGRGPNRVHLIDEVSMRVDVDLELYAIRTDQGLRGA